MTETDYPVVFADLRKTLMQEYLDTVDVPANSVVYYPSSTGAYIPQFSKTTIALVNTGTVDLDITLEVCQDSDPSTGVWFKYYPRDTSSYDLKSGESVMWSTRENIKFMRVKISNTSSSDGEVEVSLESG